MCSLTGTNTSGCGTYLHTYRMCSLTIECVLLQARTHLGAAQACAMNAVVLVIRPKIGHIWDLFIIGHIWDFFDAVVLVIRPEIGHI